LVKQNEANTLWKINDCEELLNSRVNQKYVSDAIDVLENKIKRVFQCFGESSNSNLSVYDSLLTGKMSALGAK